jgi:hypothetical protein
MKSTVGRVFCMVLYYLQDDSVQNILWLHRENPEAAHEKLCVVLFSIQNYKEGK